MSIFVTTTKTGTLRARARPKCSTNVILESTHNKPSFSEQDCYCRRVHWQSVRRPVLPALLMAGVKIVASKQSPVSYD